MFRLDPDTFKRIHPIEFHRRFLANGIRPDGRESLLSWRTPVVHTGSITTCNGSAMVRVGATAVLCGIKAEIAVPSAAEPTRGFVVSNVDLPALCSSNFRPGAPGEFTQSISDTVQSVVESAVDVDALCIEPDRAVWVLYADIVFLNYEGAAMDAALLALMAALRNTRLPSKTVYSPTDGTVRASSDLSVPITLKHLPVASTFGVVEAGGGRMLMADPTEDEDAIVGSRVSVVVDALSGDMMGTFGGHIPLELLEQSVVLATQRAKEVGQIVGASK
ncbi:ribosomal protein S5 domain 2-type protein [Chytriomyces cf. hyalinus JEL632]|nr:ribosomal protein S5 domain 2-type protein [Chytriomyces cf. hyalinus JEL632]